MILDVVNEFVINTHTQYHVILTYMYLLYLIKHLRG